MVKTNLVTAHVTSLPLPPQLIRSISIRFKVSGLDKDRYSKRFYPGKKSALLRLTDPQLVRGYVHAIQSQLLNGERSRVDDPNGPKDTSGDLHPQSVCLNLVPTSCAELLTQQPPSSSSPMVPNSRTSCTYSFKLPNYQSQFRPILFPLACAILPRYPHQYLPPLSVHELCRLSSKFW